MYKLSILKIKEFNIVLQNYTFNSLNDIYKNFKYNKYNEYINIKVTANKTDKSHVKEYSSIKPRY